MEGSRRGFQCFDRKNQFEQYRNLEGCQIWRGTQFDKPFGGGGSTQASKKQVNQGVGIDRDRPLLEGLAGGDDK